MRTDYVPVAEYRNAQVLRAARVRWCPLAQGRVVPGLYIVRGGAPRPWRSAPA